MAAVATQAKFSAPTTGASTQKDRFSRNERANSTRQQNVNAAKAVADTIRTSLGPRGMDKMIQDAKGGVMITNDGATILNEMEIAHPTARMLQELSESQDVETGDGTTSVVVLCGALLAAATELMDKGIHPQIVASGFLQGLELAQDVLKSMSAPIDLHDREALEKAVATSLHSKVVSSLASHLAPIAVDATLKLVRDLDTTDNIDLNDIKVVKQLGGTIDDSELVEGLVLAHQKVSRLAGGPTSCQNAKIGLIQFCLSLPKTDMDQSITIKDYTAMDRLLRQERLQIAKMVKKIAATGCNVLLVQKSILREAVNDLALDFLAKAGILVIRDIERDDIEFISKTLGCQPVASLDHFTPDRLGSAANVQEVAGVVKFTGVTADHTVTVLLRASNQLTLDEAERSFRDAICVVRSLIRVRALLPGGGAPETEVSVVLADKALHMKGAAQLCVRAFARAVEVIPYTLAENAGLKPIELVTDLRAKHIEGHKHAGVDVKRGNVCLDMINQLHVIQPLLVTSSAMKLATETTVMILKIDDVVLCR
eukprot:Blabericola_migrator_1__12292@NODE_768_length_6592_cov_139_084138_g546_i0_p3_GENE_NODE_768_length_6592_cov_139_084138_g546_i0NODE_768_length_6592_cov_139_084138_g546_i0_p3_ORF_typecomplete_len540_score122_75Cpn60_TCP1/PF00118_24/1e157Ribosomal_S19e/PF01090_19/0_11CoA_binding_2/PF13380_6/1_2e02CoA_binding_2/PF13380_6/3_7CoA_binding_2/PF13380_6/5_1e03_NODE_768_length_6592_cov_139_084138_g546_i049166535